MAFSPEEVNHNFAKALDHVKATASSRDAGSLAATVEALRDLISSNPELQKQLVQRVNDTLVKNPEEVKE